MYDGLMKRIAIYSAIFFVVVMCGMVYYSYNRNLQVSNSAVAENAAKDSNMKKDAREIPIIQGKDDSAYLGIPLSTATTEDMILLESNYIEKKLYITINDLDVQFFDVNSIIGDSNYANRIIWSYDSGITKLEIQLTNIYEHIAFYKNNMLFLEFVSPKEMYDKRIVIDAGSMGISDGSAEDITLAIVKKLKVKLEKTDIRAYYTRMDGSNPTEANRVELSSLLRADMLVSIHLEENIADVGTNSVQTVYNPTYFIPAFSSIDLADIMEREVVKSIGGKAVGLIPAGNADLLVNEASVPVAKIKILYLNNKKEKEFLEDDAYLEKIATGIYNGIIESYRKIDDK